MALYEMQSDKLVEIDEVSFTEQGIRERGDLQRLLKEQIDALDPDLLVLAEEFGQFEESKRRIDLLCVDRNADLVVVELKRDNDAHMDLQAVRYAAMVSTMTFAQAELELQRSGDQEARQTLLDHFGWDEPREDEFAQRVRILLAAADFGKGLTTAVLWLNDQGLDITCLRLRPHRLDERALLNIEQVIPLPEAADYMEKVREKVSKQNSDASETHERRQAFWAGLQKHLGETDLHHGRRASSSSGRFTARLSTSISLQYVVRDGEIGVDLEIRSDGKSGRNAREEFDRLAACRAEIERSVGNSLEWRRDDALRFSKVRWRSDIGSLRSETTKWPDIHLSMVQVMRRMHAAFAPHL